jgi:1-carboxybiuret hydrolase subunit AtzG-like
VSKLRKKKTPTAKVAKSAAKSRAAAKPKARAAKSATTASAPAASRKLPPDPLDQFVDAAAVAIDLPIDAAWKPAIKANLAVTLRLARLFADFPLPDDAEPAPVFVA